MSHPNMSAATLAIIAETEETPAQELPVIHIPLTLSRVFDLAGQPISNKFTCSTELSGRPINATAGKRITAYNNLQSQIRELGFEPMWNVFRDETAQFECPDDEPEETTAPDVEPVTPVESSEDTAEETDVGEHEDPAYGLVVDVPVLDKYGWLTPLSDPLAYKRVYLAAWKLAYNLSVYQISDLTAESRDARAAVAAVMMDGIAGESIGVPARAVNPWKLGTNGQQEMLWVRVCKGTPDPTTKPFRSGSGEAREAYLTTLSGLPAFPERADAARAWREKRAARSFVGTRNATTVGARDAREEKRAAAHVSGKAAKTAAILAGMGEHAETHYKWAYCAQLRLLGEIHAEYERQLLDAGVEESDILEQVERMRPSVPAWPSFGTDAA